MSQPRVELRTHVHPLALERNDQKCLATVRVDVSAPTQAATRPLNLALVIDRSGSMAGQKLETAKASSARIVEKLADDDVITVVAFSTEAEVVVPASRLGAGRSRALAAIQGIQAGDQTNMARGLLAARAQMEPHLRPDHVSAVFLITDGLASDGDEAANLAPQLGQRHILLYGAGIGADYNHDFLGRLCGKHRADHIDDDRVDRMHAMFDDFLQKEGHLVSANGRLFVTVAGGVTLQSFTCVEERGQPLSLDGQQSVAVRDLAPGRQQSFQLELALTPAAVGPRPLAAFRLRYDLPAANLLGQEERAEAQVEVTADLALAGAPNAEVVRLARKIQTVRLREKAEADLARGDVRGATEKLQRVTRRLQEQGDAERAREYQQQVDALEKASDKDRDLAIKQLRGRTKRLADD